MFLITYLVPFLSPSNFLFSDHWFIGAYIMVIIVVVVAHANAIHFNPVMGIFGYSFVGIIDERAVSRVLISKNRITERTGSLQVVRLAHNIFLEVGDRHD